KRGKNGKKPGPPVHEDLSVMTDDKGRQRHDITAAAVNELWLTDTTAHPTGQGTLYLGALKNVCSNRNVGYSIDSPIKSPLDARVKSRLDSRLKSRLAVAALDNAVARRGDVAGCSVHSDRGSQFRSRMFVHALNRHDLVGSMGRVGAAGDNAAMESFFSLL